MTARAACIVAGMAACVGGDDSRPSPGALSVEPSAFDFGTLAEFSPREDVFCLTNSGGAWVMPAVTVSPGFALLGDNCSMNNLPPREWCTLSVRVTAQGSGPSMGSITADPGAAPVALDVWVVERGDVRAGDASLDFGRQPNGTERAPMLGNIINQGGEPAGPLLLTFDGQDVGEFEFADDGCSGRTLSFGTACVFSVRMHATAASPGRKRASVVASILGNRVAATTVMGVVEATDGTPLPCGL